ncbi:MAG: helix-turn-helix domain-containing protein, partial [Candidatus Helarchaeota archaeon]
MSSDEIKRGILQELKNSHVGTSIKKLSEKLNKSRTTIAKYLNILKKEGKVISKDVGLYKIWVSSEVESAYKENQFRILSAQYYQNLLSRLTSIYPDLLEKGKDIGKTISANIEFEKFFDVITIEDLKSNINKKQSDSFILKTAMQILNSLNLIGDNYIVEPLIINPPNGFMTIK